MAIVQYFSGMTKINESILQFAWKTVSFDPSHLQTDAGEKISVIKPGIVNTDAGPDFSNAHVRIGEIDWFGSVEIHVKSSDWKLHNHQNDSAYEPVILHVVWENDQPILRKDGTAIPVLELKNVISTTLLANYGNLTESIHPIPCSPQFVDVPDVYKIQMKDAALAKRQQYKSLRIKTYYEATHHDLEESAYRLLARNFGFRLNSEAFERLATVLPYKILLKHMDQPVQMEALLFGMAGMLENVPSDPYTELLKREFNFLGYKYGIAEQKMDVVEWKFLRTRPANFPTLRISQFADFLTTIGPISSFLTQNASKKLQAMEISASKYWSEHFVFGKPSAHNLSEMGKSSKENILINSVIPLLYFYSVILSDDTLREKAMDLLESLPPEQNSITRTWNSVGEIPKNAFDSQALIEQFYTFCSYKKCLECPIGSYLIKNRNA